MSNDIDKIKNTRFFLLNYLNDLSIDHLNEIPPGFNNNIIWNLGHMVAAQQGICYVRAGLPLAIEEKYFAAYKPGTKPDHFTDQTEVQKIKDLLFTTLDQLTKDTEKGIFNNYKNWVTRYGGIELNNVNEAIAFLLFHEGLHAGVILSLKKLVVKP